MGAHSEIRINDYDYSEKEFNLRREFERIIDKVLRINKNATLTEKAAILGIKERSLCTYLKKKREQFVDPIYLQ